MRCFYHHGERAGNGHYMINVLNQNGNGGVEKTWARIDNKVVSAERHEDLFWATAMSGWTTCVFICCFIVALLLGLLRHNA